LGNVPDNYLLDGSSDPLIDDNNDNATIPYEVPFDIVVAASIVADADMVGDKASARLVAYTNPENVYVYLDWSGNVTNPSTPTSGTENTQSTGYEYAFDNNCNWESGAANNGYDSNVGSGYNPTGSSPNPNLLKGVTNVDYARVNFVFTRGGNGFTLSAGGTLNLNSVTLYVWA